MKKIILIILIIFANQVLADNESKDGGSRDQGTGWTNPDNITGSADDNCADYTATTAQEITVYNFGHDIPTSATIDSLYYDFDGYAGSAQVVRRRFTYQLTKTGGTTNTPVGSAVVDNTFDQGLSCALGNTVSVQNQGLHGTTWTPTEVNGTGYGLNAFKQGNKSDVVGFDAITSTVVYTDGGVQYKQRRRRE